MMNLHNRMKRGMIRKAAVRDPKLLAFLNTKYPSGAEIRRLHAEERRAQRAAFRAAARAERQENRSPRMRAQFRTMMADESRRIKEQLADPMIRRALEWKGPTTAELTKLHAAQRRADRARLAGSARP